MTSIAVRGWALAGLVLLSVLAARVSDAATLDVRPTLLQLLPGQKAGVLTLVNQDDAPHTFQIKSLRWFQAGAEQRQEPSDDIIATPTIVTLQPKQTQLVRYGIRMPAAGPEHAYRLIIDELPHEAALSGSSLTVLLRVSLPLFVRDVTIAPPPQLTASSVAGEHEIKVSIANHGPYTIRVARATLSGDGAPAGLQLDQLHYALPGGTADFAFPLNKPWLPRRGIITLTTDAGDVPVPLTPGG